MWMVVLAAVAFADIAPPPDYVEPCTADRAKAGEECVLCLRGAWDCQSRYEAAGFAEVCKAWGNVGERVMCRPQAGPAVPAGTMPSHHVDVVSTDVPEVQAVKRWASQLEYCYERISADERPDATADFALTIDRGVVQAKPVGETTIPAPALECMAQRLGKMSLPETSTGTANVRFVAEHVPDAQVLTTATPAPTSSAPAAPSPSAAPSVPTSSWPLGALAAVLGTGLLAAAAIGVRRRR